MIADQVCRDDNTIRHHICVHIYSIRTSVHLYSICTSVQYLYICTVCDSCIAVRAWTFCLRTGGLAPSDGDYRSRDPRRNLRPVAFASPGSTPVVNCDVIALVTSETDKSLPIVSTKDVTL